MMERVSVCLFVNVCTPLCMWSMLRCQKRMCERASSCLSVDFIWILFASAHPECGEFVCVGMTGRLMYAALH